MEDWNRMEAEREWDAFMAGEPYTYRTPEQAGLFLTHWRGASFYVEDPRKPTPPDW
jgi:hypothetical protein